MVTGDSTFLDGQYTAFGEVKSGMDVADTIGHLPRGKNDCPDQEAKIFRITISE
ncbi:MAG: peptidylprolyl isomerase [Thaumarchaeota archaeon]|nr:peptidylprolyl isomerase [Nitrososphaerota archaeon]